MCGCRKDCPEPLGNSNCSFLGSGSCIGKGIRGCACDNSISDVRHASREDKQAAGSLCLGSRGVKWTGERLQALSVGSMSKFIMQTSSLPEAGSAGGARSLSEEWGSEEPREQRGAGKGGGRGSVGGEPCTCAAK